MPADKESHQTDYPRITEAERADINRHFGRSRFPDCELIEWLAIIGGMTPAAVARSVQKARI